MRKSLQFSKMVKSKGLHDPLIVLKDDSECDKWGNALFSELPLTPEESVNAKIKGEF